MQALPPAQAEVERALVTADAAALSALLRDDPAVATAPIDGLAPLLVLLRRSSGTPPAVRGCARLLLDAGVDPNSYTIEWGGQGRISALFGAVHVQWVDCTELDASVHYCPRLRLNV
jgi:hypothetical protein